MASTSSSESTCPFRLVKHILSRTAAAITGPRLAPPAGPARRPGWRSTASSEEAAEALRAGAAGLQVLTLINEPTAAAICHGLNAQDDQTVLVCD
jgi:hypothetical protein